MAAPETSTPGDPTVLPACERAIRRAREGDRLQDEQRYDAAIEAYEQALALDRSCQPAWYSLGCAWLNCGEEARAVPCFERSTVLEAGHGPSHHNLGKARFKLGLIDEALGDFERALGGVDDFLPRTAVATILPACPTADLRTVRAIREAWARHYLPPSEPHKTFQRDPGPGRRLRLGYLSSFLGSPHWMKPVWGLINQHDRERFELHLFSDGPRADCGAGCRAHPDDRFHDLTGRSNRDAAAHIEAQRLDLLVDLNGFSRVDRLAVVAAQPAPVIIGWFNLYATSGLRQYQYLIGDAHVVTAEEEPHYVEKLLRVPGSYLTFEVGYPVPDVTDPPMSRGGSLTFGSLASLHKIGPAVVRAWAAILHRCAGTRLFLKNSQLGSAANREHLSARFAAQGIGPERLVLEGPASHYQFLDAYRHIDVALDTFPYNGGTTTTEALWQGVPVLTFWGDRWVSRTSASLLREAGLGEWVAEGVGSYVETAVRLSEDGGTPRRLLALRRGMREHLRASSVCDTAAFARRMEAIYEQVV